MSCRVPSGRVVSPTRDFVAPPLTATLGLVAVTGGQAAAHAPMHADVAPLSASNACNVKPWPLVRMVPSAVCRSVSAASPAAVAVAAGGLDAAGPYGPRRCR